MQAEYEERFRAMQAEMERRQRELMEAQDTIRLVAPVVDSDCTLFFSSGAFTINSEGQLFNQLPVPSSLACTDQYPRTILVRSHVEGQSPTSFFNQQIYTE